MPKQLIESSPRKSAFLRRRSGRKGKKRPPKFGGCFLCVNAGKFLTNSAGFIILFYVKCVDGESVNLPANRERVYGVSPCCEDTSHRWFACHSRAPREISDGVRPALEVIERHSDALCNLGGTTDSPSHVWGGVFFVSTDRKERMNHGKRTEKVWR